MLQQSKRKQQQHQEKFKLWEKNKKKQQEN